MRSIRLILVTLVCVSSFMLGGCNNPIDLTSQDFEQRVLQIVGDHPEVVLESVQAYQERQQQAVRQTRQQFLAQMQSDPTATIGNSPVRGSTTASAVLVEFSDFECPYCARAQNVLKDFVNAHAEELALVYKHFPLNEIHPQAIPAARAAWAAQQQGRFWDYHDALFARQSSLEAGIYTEIAAELGLDVEQFERDRASDASEAAVMQERQLAERLGLPGTPFLALNGEVIELPLELPKLEAALERAIASS